jgi:hypothetical protein
MRDEDEGSTVACCGCLCLTCVAERVRRTVEIWTDVNTEGVGTTLVVAFADDGSSTGHKPNCRAVASQYKSSTNRLYWAASRFEMHLSAATALYVLSAKHAAVTDTPG